LELVKVVENREASLGVKLLGDLRAVFGDADALATEVILSRLCDIEESPWGDLRGKPLDARGLARRLKLYEVNSVKVKTDGKALQGYRSEYLWDAFERYLPPTPSGPEPVEPMEPGRSDTVSQVPFAGDVPEPAKRMKPETTTLTREVPEVPLSRGSECPTPDDSLFMDEESA
jgi:hypothetical protein